MNSKKLLTLALAGVMTLGALASCGNKEEPKETETSATTKGETDAVTAIPRYDYMDAVVAPDVTIDKSAYTDLTLTVPNYLKIEDEDVQNYIQQKILFQNRIAENGTTQVKDKPLKLGDDAYIYYKGFTDGKEFEGGSNWDDESSFKLGLGSGSFIPGFEEALVGIVPNQTSKETPVEIQVTFPEDYDEKMAGKDATFQIYVEYAVQYKLPEYNVEFVEKTLKYEFKKDFYASDRARLDEFESYVRETLVEKMAANLENAKIDALWNHLIEKATCQNLPAVEVSYYVDAYKQEIQYYFDYYTSAGGDEFKKLYPTIGDFALVYMGLGEGKNWETELQDMAEKMVKKDMITHAIGEIEGIEEVTDEEYKAQIEYWVNYYYGSMTENEVVQSMGEVFLRESAFADKMKDWLLNRVTFTYEDGTPLESSDGGAETDSESETA